MTKEEKQKAIDALKISAPVMPVTQEKFMEYVQTINKIIDWLEQEPCDDAISRQSAIEAFQMFREYYSNRSNKEWVNRIEVVLNQLPPVTPQQKTGHWVEENIDKWGRKISCSECGSPPPFEHVSDGDVYSANGYGVINKTKFCPNCGAKMQEENVSTLKYQSWGSS